MAWWCAECDYAAKRQAALARWRGSKAGEAARNADYAREMRAALLAFCAERLKAGARWARLVAPSERRALMAWASERSPQGAWHRAIYDAHAARREGVYSL